MNPMSNFFLVVGLTLALSACSFNEQARFKDAATSPLSDLNLMRVEIPEPLIEAQKQPYAVPTDLSCHVLDEEVLVLDVVLGPDLDAPAVDADESMMERGSNEAKSAAEGALRSTTEGIVPFRGWVRKLSGAARHSKKVAAAINAGTVRRAFLKGLRVAKACKVEDHAHATSQ